MFPGDFSYYSGYLYYLCLEIPKPDTNTDSPSVQTFIASSGFPTEIGSLSEAEAFLDRVWERYDTALCIDDAGLSLDKVPDQAQINLSLLDDLKRTVTAYNGVMPVSYTHLDLYKRQSLWLQTNMWRWTLEPAW